CEVCSWKFEHPLTLSFSYLVISSHPFISCVAKRPTPLRRSAPTPQNRAEIDPRRWHGVCALGRGSDSRGMIRGWVDGEGCGQSGAEDVGCSGHPHRTPSDTAEGLGPRGDGPGDLPGGVRDRLGDETALMGW